MFGILNLNKPAGITSRDAINRIARKHKKLKVGHAGTLDPLATGVLVTCIGPATRLVPYVQQMPKSYSGKFLLGFESETEDVEGELRQVAAPVDVTEKAIAEVIPQFIGQIKQRPPAFSALRVKGKRAYDLARAGKPVEIPEREIEVYSIELERLGPAQFIPEQLKDRHSNLIEFDLKIVCGSGTYIRSLGRDIALALGTAGVMTQLCRTGIGPFTLEQAVHPDELDEVSLSDLLLPPEWALDGIPTAVASVHQQKTLANGGAVHIPSSASAGDEVRIMNESGNLLAVSILLDSGLLQPKINFANYWTS